MSSEEEIVRDEVDTQIKRFAKVLWGLVGIGMSVATVVASQEFRIRDTQEVAQTTKTEVDLLKDWRIEVSNTRYTLKDHAEDMKLRNEEKLVMERRLLIAEENQKKTFELLNRLEEQLTK